MCFLKQRLKISPAATEKLPFPFTMHKALRAIRSRVPHSMSPQEQLCVTPGIIPALYQLTETLCTKDEKVLVNTPAYGYFVHAAGYIRLNLAMPRSIIETGLVRMVNAIREERGRTPKPAEYRQA